ncbi:hypothetical protein [Methylorubrum extorquens]|uniref:Uncharacterized protein n=1 Tax=Methylorubrum extorquens DSM 13060 TaxID=882800 RepID=H1KKN8_METEX|nr:hypothetical protein [Methylorubrum extorquens]EHP91889.1 hypothetical protein MetexDRAFT_3200 [Methylorubrum extorquens DSM 13060]
MAIVNVIVSGPVGSGKSALCFEILAALRAIGVQAEVVGQSSDDVDGDPIRSLEIYRETLNVVVSENLMNERMVSARVGGSYQMPDGRGFWVDAPVAQEIARRALGISPSSNDRLGGSA